MVKLATDDYTGDGVTTDYTISFSYLQESHVEVYVAGTLQTEGAGNDYTIVTGTTVRFNAGSIPASSAVIQIRRNSSKATRLVDYTAPGNLTEADLDTDSTQAFYRSQEAEDRASEAMQEDYADAHWNAASKPIKNVTDPTSAQDAATKAYVDTEVAGTATAQAAAEAAQAAAEAAQTAAESAETNAQTSETNAATSETNAATSETNAAASAASAAASAENIIYNDVTYITFADSPYTPTAAQDGELISVDTSGGAVSIVLGSIATLGNGWRISLKKTTGDGNAITVTAAGSETIDLGASLVISAAGSGSTLIADTDGTPDDWTSVGFGASAGNMTVDTFVDTTDYTSGTTTQLTLSISPGSENNTTISFDGVTQHRSTWSLSGAVVTFDAAIPTGTAEVEATTGSTLSVGTPADGTVTSAKLSGDITVPGDLTVTDNFIMDVGTVTASTTQTQAGGQALTTDNVLISTCANQGDSVVLPSAVAGRSVWITNSGAEAAWVWPASGDAINEGTTDARDPVPLWPKESREYRAHDATGFYTPRMSGQRVLLDTKTASASSSLDFTTGIDGTYDQYELDEVNLIVSSSGQSIYLRFSEDGGSTWVQGTNYAWAIKGHNTSGVDQDNGTTGTGNFNVPSNVGDGTTGGGASGTIKIYRPADTGQYTNVLSHTMNDQGGGDCIVATLGGAYRRTQAVNGFQIITSSGTLTAGTVNLYGIVK